MSNGKDAYESIRVDVLSQPVFGPFGVDENLQQPEIIAFKVLPNAQNGFKSITLETLQFIAPPPDLYAKVIVRRPNSTQIDRIYTSDTDSGEFVPVNFSDEYGAGLEILALNYSRVEPRGLVTFLFNFRSSDGRIGGEFGVIPFSGDDGPFTPAVELPSVPPTVALGTALKAVAIAVDPALFRLPIPSLQVPGGTYQEPEDNTFTGPVAFIDGTVGFTNAPITTDSQITVNNDPIIVIGSFIESDGVISHGDMIVDTDIVAGGGITADVIGANSATIPTITALDTVNAGNVIVGGWVDKGGANPTINVGGGTRTGGGGTASSGSSVAAGPYAGRFVFIPAGAAPVASQPAIEIIFPVAFPDNLYLCELHPGNAAMNTVFAAGGMFADQGSYAADRFTITVGATALVSGTTYRLGFNCYRV